MMKRIEERVIHGYMQVSTLYSIIPHISIRIDAQKIKYRIHLQHEEYVPSNAFDVFWRIQGLKDLGTMNNFYVVF